MARYAIDPLRSRVWIDARSSLHPIHSETDGVEGYLELDLHDGGGVDLTAAPKGHLSLPVERLRSGNRLEDRELQRRIDARRYRTIDGELLSMETTGRDGSLRVSGEVTFRGVSRTYTDEMVLSVVDDDTVRLQGAATFDIRDFGMEPPRILMLKVEPEVGVRVEVVAVKEGPT